MLLHANKSTVNLNRTLIKLVKNINSLWQCHIVYALTSLWKKLLRNLE